MKSLKPIRMTALKYEFKRLPSRVRWFGFAVATLILVACSPNQQAPGPEQAYKKQLESCSKELSKSPLVPIIGGGRLDTRMFDFAMPTIRVEDAQCGTDGFETSFYPCAT